MSILLGVWLGSLTTIIAIVFYGRFLYARRAHEHEHVPVHIHDLLAHEIVNLNKEFSKLIESAKPHGVRTARVGLVIIKRGKELFVRRIYGRMKIEKGSTSSFFLKHISEHKEQIKKEQE